MDHSEANALIDSVWENLPPDSAISNANIAEWVATDIKEAQRVCIEKAVDDLLKALFIDSSLDHNTRETPKRIAKMLVDELFVGKYQQPPKVTVFKNAQSFDELIIQGPIDVKSTCAHHFLPFIGKAWVGLLPSIEKKDFALVDDSGLIGLSKYARVVDHFSRRPQMQEELNVQIVDFFDKLLKPRGVAVLIKATHFCMACRGVNQQSSTITSVVRGEFKASPSLKAEFLQLIAPDLGRI